MGRRGIVFLSGFTGKSVSESVSERERLEAGLEARNGWAGGLETYSWRLVMGGLEA
jgi:hypothetical protein